MKKILFFVCLLLTELTCQKVTNPSIDTTLQDIDLELSHNQKELLAIIHNPDETNFDYMDFDFFGFPDTVHQKPREKKQEAKYSDMTIFAFYVEGIGVSLLALIGKYFWIYFCIHTYIHYPIHYAP